MTCDLFWINSPQYLVEDKSRHITCAKHCSNSILFEISMITSRDLGHEYTLVFPRNKSSGKQIYPKMG